MARPAGTRKHRPVDAPWAFVPADRAAVRAARHPARNEYRLLEAYLLGAARVAPVYVGGIDPATATRSFAEVPFEVVNACRGVKPREVGTLEWLEGYAASVGATVRPMFR